MRERAREARREKRRGDLRARRAVAAGAVMGATALFAPQAAGAATFTVDNTTDANGASACDAAAPNDCSLRQAIDHANATFSADVISFSSLSGTITLTHGMIGVGHVGIVGGDVTIQGPGADQLTVSGDADQDGQHDVDLDADGGDSPIFRFNGYAGQTDTVSGLTLSGGTSGAFTDVNGLVRGTKGGAIYSAVSNLIISDSVLTDNHATLDGGAVYALGNLTIANSQVTGNTAFETGAGVQSHATAGQLTIEDSTISGNQTYGKNYAPLGPAFDYGSGNGGGVVSFARHNTISGSAISNNAAQDYNTPAGIETYVTSVGGGLYIDAGTYQSDIDVSDSTVTGNTSVSAGGGAWLKSEGTRIENSTISGNGFSHTHGPAYGGGLFTRRPTTIEDSTVSGNGTSDGGDPVYGGGVFAVGLTQLDGTTVSGNRVTGSDGGVGGGIGWSSYDGTGLTVSQSTVSGNSAPGGSGGGVGLFTQNVYYTNPDTGLTYHLDHSGPVSVRNSTIALNMAGAAGGVYENAYSTAGHATSGVQLSSALVGDNGVGDLGTYGSTAGFVVGHSLIESCSDDFFLTPSPAGSNVFGLDPMLGALADNGGPTQTQLPAADSPALDAGVSNGQTVDQRGIGFPRVVDTGAANRGGSDGADVGAVERRDGGGDPAPGAANCGTLPPSPPPGDAGSPPPPPPPSQHRKKHCKKNVKRRKQARAAKKCKKRKRAAVTQRRRGESPPLRVMRSPGR
jgi:hypothetical protein